MITQVDENDIQFNDKSSTTTNNNSLKKIEILNMNNGNGDEKKDDPFNAFDTISNTVTPPLFDPSLSTSTPPLLPSPSNESNDIVGNFTLDEINHHNTAEIVADPIKETKEVVTIVKDNSDNSEGDEFGDFGDFNSSSNIGESFIDSNLKMDNDGDGQDNSKESSTQMLKDNEPKPILTDNANKSELIETDSSLFNQGTQDKETSFIQMNELPPPSSFPTNMDTTTESLHTTNAFQTNDNQVENFKTEKTESIDNSPIMDKQCDTNFGAFDSLNPAPSGDDLKSLNKLGVASETDQNDGITGIMQVDSEDGFGDFDSFDKPSVNTTNASHIESDKGKITTDKLEREDGAFDGSSETKTDEAVGDIAESGLLNGKTSVTVNDVSELSKKSEINKNHEVPKISQMESSDGFDAFEPSSKPLGNIEVESKQESDKEEDSLYISNVGTELNMDNGFSSFNGIHEAIDKNLSESMTEAKSDNNLGNEIPLISQVESEDGFGDFDSFNKISVDVEVKSEDKSDKDDNDKGEKDNEDDGFGAFDGVDGADNAVKEDIDDSVTEAKSNEEAELAPEMNQTNEIPLISQVESEDGFGDFDSFNKTSVDVEVKSEDKSDKDGKNLPEETSEDDGFGAFDGVSNGNEADLFVKPTVNIMTEPKQESVEDNQNTEESEDDDFGAFDDANDVSTGELSESPGNKQRDDIQETSNMESEDSFGDFDSSKKTSINTAVELKKESDKDDNLNKVESDVKDDFSDDDDFGDFGAFEETKVEESYEQDGKDPFLLRAESAFEQAFISFGNLHTTKLDSSFEGFNPLSFESILGNISVNHNATHNWSEKTLDTFLDNKEIIGNAPPRRIFINRLSTDTFSNYDQGNFQIDLGKPFVSKNPIVTDSFDEDQQLNSPVSKKDTDDTTFMPQNDSSSNKEVDEDEFDNNGINKEVQDTIRISENNVESNEKAPSTPRGVGSAFRKAIKGIRRNGSSPSISKRDSSDKKELSNKNKNNVKRVSESEKINKATELLLSQIPDLSFMLQSKLSLPGKKGDVENIESDEEFLEFQSTPKTNADNFNVFNL